MKKIPFYGMLKKGVLKVYQFDENIKKQVLAIVKQYNHNIELLSFQEVLIDSKLTTYLLKQNSAVQDIVFLYEQLTELEDKIEQQENVENKEQLKNQIAKIEDEICLLLSKKGEKFENVTIEVVSKSDDGKFAKFILDGVKASCHVLGYSFSLRNELNVSYVEICGFGALKVFLPFAGIHREKAFGKQGDCLVYVYQTPVLDVFDFNDESIKVDVFRSGGHGGQSVNTTDSAVRVTHLKTKLSATCQDERSQLQNKEKAMALLKEKLNQIALKNASQVVYKEKKEQVKMIEHGFVCKTYDFDKKIVINTADKAVISFERFLSGKI